MSQREGEGDGERWGSRIGGGDGDGEQDEFYLRYYVEHKGKFGHEILEFEFRPDGNLRTPIIPTTRTTP